MKNKIGKTYRKYVLERHIRVSIFLVLFLVLTGWMFDTIGNHLLVNKIEELFGLGIAELVMKNKYPLMILLSFFVVFAGWVIVEIKELFFVSDVLNKMEITLSEDKDIQLNKRFEIIENSVNKIKMQNRLNLQKADMEVERKNDLITYLAHDIRTPLASIMGYLSLLDEVPDLPEEQRMKYVGITLKKSYRLEELINEFFDITRFNLSSIPLEKEYISLKLMLEQLAEDFYPLLTQGNRVIEVFALEEEILYGDPDKLARVFSNLIKNAISYSYENSKILIKSQKIEQAIIIEVINEGKQISKEKLERIFERFFRLDDSRSSNSGGAGLGLAIAKEIVHSHDGTITAVSNEKQTVFTVRLPQ